MGDIPPSTAACLRGIVTGVRSPGRDNFPRLEIDDFCTKQDGRLNLLLLALEDLQRNSLPIGGEVSPLQNQWSYFQLAGIHGDPTVAWGGVEATKFYSILNAQGKQNIQNPFGNPPAIRNFTQGDKTKGYCPHGGIQFLPWHRAYAMAFEQSCQAKMHEIAETYASAADKAAYHRIANEHRTPYWNPFQSRYLFTDGPTEGFPALGLSLIFCVRQVRVKRPNTTGWVTINNPLYRYQYPTLQDFEHAGSPVNDEPFDTNPWRKFFRRNVNNPGALELNTTRAYTILNPVPNPNTGACNNSLVQRNLTGGMVPRNVPGNWLWLPVVYPTLADDIPDREWRVQFGLAGMKAKLYASLTDQYGALSFGQFATSAYFIGIQTAADPARVSVDDFEPRSCESFHNDIHTLLATPYGSMTPPNKSAFDPIFQFWHSFIDFVWVLHQALHKQNNGDWWSITDDIANTDPNWSVEVPTKETPEDALTPFKMDPRTEGRPWKTFKNRFTTYQNEFWTANDVRDYTKLGYYYKPIRPSMSDADKRKAALLYINETFSWIQPLENQRLGKDVDTDSSAALSAGSMPDMTNCTAFVPREGPGDAWPPLIDDEEVDLETFYNLTPAGPAPAPPPPVIAPPPPVIAPSPPPPVIVPPSVTTSDLLAVPYSTSDIAEKEVIVAHGPVEVAEENVTSRVQVDMMKHQKTASQTAVHSIQQVTPENINGDTKHQQINGDHNISNGNLPQHTVDSSISDAIIREGTIRNWSFQYRSQRHALNTAFTVYLFLGEFLPEVSQWAHAENLVLCLHNFAWHHDHLVGDYSVRGDNPNREPTDDSSQPGECSNCRRQAEARLMNANWAPLTPKLVDYVLTGRPASTDLPENEAVLRSLEQEDVIPFLTRHLHWRVVRCCDNKVIHCDDVAGFKAWVHDETMILPTHNGEMPRYHGHQIHHSITHGRPGGLNQGEHPRRLT